VKAQVVAAVFFIAALVAAPGCLVAPKTELNAALAQNRVLMEQNRAQLIQIENLTTHNRDVENKLIRDEQQLACRHDPAEGDATRN
jgi:hypothetical protein